MDALTGTPVKNIGGGGGGKGMESMPTWFTLIGGSLILCAMGTRRELAAACVECVSIGTAEYGNCQTYVLSLIWTCHVLH